MMPKDQDLLDALADEPVLARELVPVFSSVKVAWLVESLDALVAIGEAERADVVGEDGHVLGVGYRRRVRTGTSFWMTFTEHRATLLAQETGLSVDEWLASVRCDHDDVPALVRLASGCHGSEAAALAYARENGPAWVLGPWSVERRLVVSTRVEQARDAGMDAAVAVDERRWADHRPPDERGNGRR